MGKKIRNKPKDLKKKRHKKKVFNEVKHDNTLNDLVGELNRITEQKRKNPSSMSKNKMKRKEIVLLRNSTKNRLKAKLRRKRQSVREELGKFFEFLKYFR